MSQIREFGPNALVVGRRADIAATLGDPQVLRFGVNASVVILSDEATDADVIAAIRAARSGGGSSPVGEGAIPIGPV